MDKVVTAENSRGGLVPGAVLGIIETVRHMFDETFKDALAPLIEQVLVQGDGAFGVEGTIIVKL